MIVEPSMLSVIIPIFNEAPSRDELHKRLTSVLENTGRSYEILFVDDGSRDGSMDVLRLLHARDPKVRVVRFNRNYGQHAAVPLMDPPLATANSASETQFECSEMALIPLLLERI